MRLRRRRRGRAPSSEAPSSSPVLPEVAASRYRPWLARLESTSFWAMALRLPAMFAMALGWGWRANRRDTIATVELNLASGVFTAFGLIAVAGVLESLFAEGPTPQRVQAALPSLLLVAGAATMQGALQAGAGWAQARLEPQVQRSAELELFDLTSRIRLEAFDDSGLCDSMSATV